jgi:hypothetical protein
VLPSSGLSTEIFSRSGTKTSPNKCPHSHKILVDNVVEGTYTVHYERNQAWAALRNVAVEHGQRLARHNMGERYRSERSGTGSMMNDCDGWPGSAPSWAQGDTTTLIAAQRPMATARWARPGTNGAVNNHAAFLSGDAILFDRTTACSGRLAIN